MIFLEVFIAIAAMAFLLIPKITNKTKYTVIVATSLLLSGLLLSPVMSAIGLKGLALGSWLSQPVIYGIAFIVLTAVIGGVLPAGAWLTGHSAIFVLSMLIAVIDRMEGKNAKNLVKPAATPITSKAASKPASGGGRKNK